MAIKIEMLRCFAAVAQSGNLSDAADTLNRSPSAVSMMLKQLEEHLGAALFESDRKANLSPVGQFVLEQAQEQLRQFDNTVEAIEGFSRGGKGKVSIASVPSFASTILPLAFKKFRAIYKDVRIELRDMDSASIVNALGKDNVDIGIASVTSEQRILSTDKNRVSLLADQFVLVCHRDHHICDVEARWCDIDVAQFISNELCAKINVPQFNEIGSNAPLVVHNTLSLLAMVRAGHGITVLPQLAVPNNDETLVSFPLIDPPAFRHIELIHRARNAISPAALRLIDIIIETSQET